MLAEGANRFSQGDYAVRTNPKVRPKSARRLSLQQHGEQHRSLIASLGKSESKNKLLRPCRAVSEAIWTQGSAGIIQREFRSRAMFGYPRPRPWGTR